MRELLGELKARLAVSQKLVDADHDIHDEISLSPSSGNDIVEQVTRYLEAGHSAAPGGESGESGLAAKEVGATTP